MSMMINNASNNMSNNTSDNTTNNTSDNTTNNTTNNANTLTEFAQVGVSPRALQGSDGQKITRLFTEKNIELRNVTNKLEVASKKVAVLEEDAKEDKKFNRDSMNVLKINTNINASLIDMWNDDRKRQRINDSSNLVTMTLVAKIGDVVSDLKGTRPPNPRPAIAGCIVHKIVISESIKYHIRNPDGSDGGSREGHNIRRE